MPSANPQFLHLPATLHPVCMILGGSSGRAAKSDLQLRRALMLLYRRLQGRRPPVRTLPRWRSLRSAPLHQQRCGSRPGCPKASPSCTCRLCRRSAPRSSSSRMPPYCWRCQGGRRVIIHPVYQADSRAVVYTVQASLRLLLRITSLCVCCAASPPHSPISPHGVPHLLPPHFTTSPPGLGLPGPCDSRPVAGTGVDLAGD